VTLFGWRNGGRAKTLIPPTQMTSLMMLQLYVHAMAIGNLSGIGPQRHMRQGLQSSGRTASGQPKLRISTSISRNLHVRRHRENKYSRHVCKLLSPPKFSPSTDCLVSETRTPQIQADSEECTVFLSYMIVHSPTPVSAMRFELPWIYDHDQLLI
jgi:hypothetical protein